MKPSALFLLVAMGRVMLPQPCQGQGIASLTLSPPAAPARAQGQLDPRPSPAFSRFRPPPSLPARAASVRNDPDDQRKKGMPWEEIVGVVFIVLTVGAFVGIFFDHS